MTWLYTDGWLVVLAFAAGMLVERAMTRRRAKRYAKEREKVAADISAIGDTMMSKVPKVPQWKPPK